MEIEKTETTPEEIKLLEEPEKEEVKEISPTPELETLQKTEEFELILPKKPFLSKWVFALSFFLIILLLSILSFFLVFPFTPSNIKKEGKKDISHASFFTLPIEKDSDTSEWKIKNSDDETVDFPQISKIPVFGKINETEPAIFKKNDIIIISLGSSPIGVSFLVNKCFAYLSQFRTFTPVIKTDTCPKITPTKEDSCDNFIKSIPSCTTPTEELPQTLSKNCQNYINAHFNYNGCVAEHENDSDFYSNEWRIFLGQEKSFFKNPLMIEKNGEILKRFSL